MLGRAGANSLGQPETRVFEMLSASERPIDGAHLQYLEGSGASDSWKGSGLGREALVPMPMKAAKRPVQPVQLQSFGLPHAQHSIPHGYALFASAGRVKLPPIRCDKSPTTMVPATPRPAQ